MSDHINTTIGVSEDRVHRIVDYKLKDEIKPLEKEFDDLRKEVQTVSTTVTAINTKMISIYGNGSGRKGILDEIRDSQDEQDKKIAQIQEELRIEAARKANSDQTKGKAKEWVKYVAGGAAVIVWTLFKKFVLHMN